MPLVVVETLTAEDELLPATCKTWDLLLEACARFGKVPVDELAILVTSIGLLGKGICVAGVGFGDGTSFRVGNTALDAEVVVEVFWAKAELLPRGIIFESRYRTATIVDDLPSFNELGEMAEIVEEDGFETDWVDEAWPV
jgi:hypothetical protein